jgi:Ca-activated chloride channel family protein
VRPRTVGPKAEAVPTPVRTDNTPAPLPPNSTVPPQDAEAIDENEVVRVDSNLVIIPASVVDNRGHAITDLKVEDFELRVDGEVKSIGDLSRAETPVHVAMLFDNSASLSTAREFEKQAAVRFFRAVVRPIDRAAIYSISTTPTLSQPLTNDVSRLVRTVERFGKPDGATALFDSLAQAADYMRPLTGRKVLVLVSDGTDTVSDASFEEAVNRALRAECQVYVVQTRQVEDPNLHDPVSEQRMFKLTEQTGGAVYVPQSVDDLDAVFTQISLDLSQQYLLSYYPQEERKDKFFRFIGLRVKTRPNLRVRARKGFYPSSAQNDAQMPDQRAGVSGGPLNTARVDRLFGGVAPASPSPDLAARQNTSASGHAPTARPSADTVGVGRKPGPDGPDEEERPNQDASAPESTPTFTLTTVASVTTPKTAATTEPTATPTPAPAPPPTPETSSTDTNSQTRTSTPTPDASQPPAQSVRAESDARPKAPVSGGVLNSKALTLPKPIYPQSARTAGASGKVVVEVTIDEQGRVVDARIVSGHPLLQAAAVLAARQARFSPTMLSGEPVKVKGTISYTFVWP